MSNIGMQKVNTETVTPERIEQAAYFTPLVDIIETNEAFIFQADLPGVKAADVDVTFENGVLTMDGQVPRRQNPTQNYIWQEYGVGHFYRQFTLNTPIDSNAIKAEYKNGVLELRVPKVEAAKARKIQIKAA